MVTCHHCEAGWHCLMGPAVQERMGERTKGHGISIFASYSIHKSAECSKSLIWQQKTNPWFGWEHRKLLRLLWYYFKDPKVSSAPFRLDKNPLLSLIRLFVPRLNSIAVFLGICQRHLVFCSFSAAVPRWLFVTAASCDFLSICFIQAAQTLFSGHWHWRDWSTK